MSLKPLSIEEFTKKYSQFNSFYDKEAFELLEKPLFKIWLMYDQATAHTYTLKRMMETALRCNVAIRIVNVDAFLFYCDNSAENGVKLTYDNKPIEQLPDVVLCRLGAMRCNAHSMRVLRVLQKLTVVLNHDAPIQTAANKLETAFALAANGVETPKTIPLNVTNAAATRKLVTDALGYPVVIKTAIGSQGDGVMLIDNEARLAELCGLLDKQRQFLAQEFIAASAGSDVRVWVVGNKCVAAMRRKGAEGAGIRANIHQGGSATNVELTDALCKVAIGAAQALGLDMAGVDLLERGDGRFCVCEVNAAAGIEAFEHATGKDVALSLIELCARKFNESKN